MRRSLMKSSHKVDSESIQSYTQMLKEDGWKRGRRLDVIYESDPL